MRVPTYADGKPTNLQAAIIDAEYWLHWLRSQINDPQLAGVEMRETVRTGLHRAIEALEKFVPEAESRNDGQN